jgi:hypothetical protein
LRLRARNFKRRRPGIETLKLGALVTVSVRRIKVAIASACPLKPVFAIAQGRLCSAAA